jgi:hypothetical protein
MKVVRSVTFEYFEDGRFSLDAELIADLEARCMLAGVPHFAGRTYRLGYEAARIASNSAVGLLTRWSSRCLS